MSTELAWLEIARRMVLTLAAGSLLGFNRWERGRAAGLRTTVLVTLAASVSMIQTNLLLGTAGKAANSFVVMDVMRLPLGILSGMGFIGAGVILRREHAITGVTTAATLWFATVIGLCLGGGQTITGLVSLALGLTVLRGFRGIERHIRQERAGTLTMTVSGDRPVEEELRSYLTGSGVHVVSWGLRNRAASGQYTLRCEIHWKSTPEDSGIPPFVDRLAQQSGIMGIEWDENTQSEV